MHRSPSWIAGAALAGAALTPAWSAQQPFAEGEPFPDLVLPRLRDGRPATLADLRGRKLVLHVFASW